MDIVTLGKSGGITNTIDFLTKTHPPSQIAAFHTDLYLDENGGGSGDVYFQDFGNQAIIQFNHAARIAQDGFSTFQIVLNADGTILFYYLDMSGTLNDCVVGLQNETKDKGLTVAYQQAYLKNNLAVRLVDSIRWLTVSPVSGVVASDESAALGAVLDARSLIGGNFTGTVTISASSSLDLNVTVPVAMNINAGQEITIISPPEGGLFAEATEAMLQASALDQDGVTRWSFTMVLRNLVRRRQRHILSYGRVCLLERIASQCLQLITLARYVVPASAHGSTGRYRSRRNR